MKNKQYINTLILFAGTCLLVFTMSCKTSRIANEQTNYVYDNKIKDINPSYFVYHKMDTVSYLYFEIQTKNLLYVRESREKPFEAEVKIQYEIYEGYKRKNILSSGNKIIYDYKTAPDNKNIIGKIPLNYGMKEGGILKITAYDINKKYKTTTVIELNKKNKFSNQFFLIKDKETGDVCFDNFFGVNKSLEIISDFNKDKTFSLEYFNTDFPPTLPPFSTKDVPQIKSKNDSSYEFTFTGNSAEVTLNKKGSFFLTKEKEYGIVFHCFESEFDNFSNYDELIGPLKYICTSSEYRNLTSAEDKRKAFENFWIKMCGSKERSKIVIEEYYRRVKLANTHFSNYREGWKTDRGMLSIVMGLPNTIYKSHDGETWIYGTPHNILMSLTFNFNQKNKDKSSNDYQLIRYRTFRDYWYRACQGWRQGRIYNFN